MSAQDPYPIARAVLQALLQPTSPSPPSTAPFTVGPGVLRAPPRRSRAPGFAAVVDEAGADVADWGAVVEDVYVDDDSGAVHLVFRAEALGGLRLILQKTSAGLCGRFIVADGAARRAWEPTIAALVARMAARGKPLVSHTVETP